MSFYYEIKYHDLNKSESEMRKNMLTICDNINRYLESSYYIDWKNEAILQMAKQFLIPHNDIETTRKTYLFVRDKIKHSWDIQDKRVTAKASDVLKEKVGICWAKSNLLAALLRANNIPAGICYQRLTLGDSPETGYCIHALSAVYLASIKKWIRLDARGNKEGINAEMCIEEEKLAFPVRTELDEIDYKIVYAEPLPLTMDILENSTDALYMCLHSLPDRI